MHYLQAFPLICKILLLLSCFDVSRASDLTTNEISQSVVVDISGKGNFTTVQSAIDSIPSGNSKWIRIQVLPGIYREKVKIPNDKPFIFLDGGGSRSTFIEFGDASQTDTSATFTSLPENIFVKGITFRNTYNVPPNDTKDLTIRQAVAARIYGDKTAFFQCGFVGLQDTLWDASGRHYYRACYIEGVIDFIFGSGQSIFEKCLLNVPIDQYAPQLTMGYITAQARNSSEATNGFVFKNCIINGSGKSYLGRAYGAYSRVIFYKSQFGDVIVPEGWDAWSYVGKENNFEYGEIGCFGPGSDTSKRVPWSKKVGSPQLVKFSDISYINADGWISELPYVIQI